VLLGFRMRKAALALVLLSVLFCILVTSCNGATAWAGGTITIEADGSVNPASAPVLRDGDLYTLTANINGSVAVRKNNIIVDGNGRTLLGAKVGYGFDLSGVTNVTVKNAVLRGFSYGVYANSSHGNRITGNTFTENVWDGIWLRDSQNNTVDMNLLANNYGGIAVFDSTGNEILKNTISLSGNVGIEMYRSSNNTIWGNSMIGNTYEVHSTASTNMWDMGYPTGGNYWSDYTGTDGNGDGIGDTAYLIDFSNQDRYPLMNADVIPEFPVLLFTSVLMVAATLATLTYKRKQTQKQDLSFIRGY